jgi:hypothetical protein
MKEILPFLALCHSRVVLFESTFLIMWWGLHYLVTAATVLQLPALPKTVIKESPSNNTE